MSSARERGAVGSVEVLALALLVFVGGALLLASAWGVVDAKLAASTAAREAARTYAEGDGGTTGRDAARRAAVEAIRAGGRSPQRLALDGPDGSLDRCGTIRYTARYEVPTVRIPWVGGLGRIEVRARHATRVDRLRAGLQGAVTC